MIEYNQRYSVDLRIFLTIICTLIIIGSVFIYSASSIYALEHFGSAHYFVKRHCLGLTLGFMAFFGAQLIPVWLYDKASFLLFSFSLFLTSLTLVPGLTRHIHGSSRWLNLGYLVFQPSEIAKIALILYVASFINRTSIKQRALWSTYLPLFIPVGIFCLILLKQPDFGLTVTMILTILILLFIAHMSLTHIGILIGSFCISGIALIMVKPYRIQRILTFLNPWNDPRGSGFQIIQSLIAIGSGGFCGIGIGNSKQKFFYLPMQCTDFIFSIIAEEVGFLGALSLIIVYMLFMYFGIRIAYQAKSAFGFFTTLGFIIMLSLQTIINIAVTTGLAPTKGIGLPFISYGNTALVCNMLMIGIILHIVRESNKYSLNYP